MKWPENVRCQTVITSTVTHSAVRSCCLSPAAEMGSTTPTPSHFPRVILHPSPVTAAAGERVTLECRADKAVCYDWYRNNELIKSQVPTGILTIESFSTADVGAYVCEVVNDHGREKSKTVRVELGGCLYTCTYNFLCVYTHKVVYMQVWCHSCDVSYILHTTYMYYNNNNPICTHVYEYS